MITPAQYVVSVLGNGVLTIAVVWLLLHSVRRDPRALRNGLFCVVAVYAGLNLVEALLSWSTED